MRKNNNGPSIGIDIESIRRFEHFDQRRDGKLFKSIFTAAELRYCFARREPALHLAARFAAKEAVVKAFGSLHVAGVNYKDVEITRSSNGAPMVRLKKAGYAKFVVMVSLSHTEEYAVASAIVSQKIL